MNRIAVLVLISLLSLSCASSTPERSATASLTFSDGDDTASLSLGLSDGMVRSLLEEGLGHELTCDGDLDRDLRTMLDELDRRRWSSATLEDEDTEIRARRRGQRLHLDIRPKSGGTSLEATMPWAVAECLLGRTTTLAEALGVDGRRGKIEVEIHGDEGGTLAFTLD